VREELFHIRGELALLRARSGYGRRDVFTLAELLRLGNRREVEAIIREHCQPVPMPDGTLLCRVLARYKMQLDGRDGGLAPHLLLDGFWEWWITEFVCRNLERGEVALDVGACYGYYTMVFADPVGAEGRVHAFEPNPTAHALLARNIALNGLAPHVTAHAVAVAEGGGRAVGLRVPPTDPQSARVLPGEPPEPAVVAGQDGEHPLAVPSFALDELGEQRVDLVKIDAPWSEEAIWRGMQGLIAGNPRIRVLIDFHPGRVADPAGLLAEFGRHFPLRRVEGDAHARPCAAGDVIAQDAASMLYLSRVEPN
jgi:FkbM family methyltransferase